VRKAIIPKLLPQVFDTIRLWVKAHEARKVKIKTPEGMEFEFSGKVSPEDVLSFLRAVTKNKTPHRAVD
jgi:hypothetical protein